uniref:Alpha/beta hydrolase fold-3 domain-containing protein n=1 Tax=Biomphalaria glabrata TaxID=6526 RepID=A0A2C9M005_BIOGL
MAERQIWAPFADKYKVHEESYEFVRLMLETGIKPYSELGVDKSREQSRMRSCQFGGSVEFKGEEREIIIPSPYAAEGIPATIYKPDTAPEVPAIFVYYHGGGLVLCSRETHASALKVIASRSGAIIVNVEYRLLPNPESPYAPFDDAAAAAEWVLKNKEAVGGRSDSKVGVGGDSAGGQLTASVTNDVLGLDFQVLVYPLTDTLCKNPTFQEFKNVPGLNSDAIKWFFDNSLLYIPDYKTNPRINVMVRTNTELSPPALVLLAELDPLRGCGLDYAEKLRDAGVSVQCEVVEGVPHAFFTLITVFPTKTNEAYEHVVKFIKQFQ